MTSDNIEVRFSSPEALLARRKEHMDECIRWLQSNIDRILTSRAIAIDPRSLAEKGLGVEFNIEFLESQCIYNMWEINDAIRVINVALAASGWEVSKPLEVERFNHRYNVVGKVTAPSKAMSRGPYR